MVKFPHVEVQLAQKADTKGYRYQCIIAVANALRAAGYPWDAKVFTDTALESESYEAMMKLVNDTVTVI